MERANCRDDERRSRSLSRPLPLLNSLTLSDTPKKSKTPLLRKDYLEIQYANVRVPVDPSIVEGNCVQFKV